MENGEICLEFLRVKDKEERVIEVFHISSDGLQVGHQTITCHLISAILYGFLYIRAVFVKV